MTEIKCPLCGSLKFYVKDPDDEYEICEFECIEGEIVFQPELDADEVPEIRENTQTYCDKCAWHGKFDELKKK